MLKIAHLSAIAILAITTGGCVSQAEFVNPEQSSLDAPEPKLRPPIPLKVAVHIHPEVVKASRLWSKSLYGTRLQYGNFGYEVVDAATEYFPQAFLQAWLLQRFPAPGLDPRSVDAVVVVESAGSAAHAAPGPFDGKVRINNELTIGIYTLDGNLIHRYVTVGSDYLPIDTFSGGGSESNNRILNDRAGIAVRPSMRRALINFPTDTVTSALAADKALLATRLAAADSAYWDRQRTAYESRIAAGLAKWPKDAVDGAEYNRSVLRAAGIMAGLNAANLSRMPQTNSANAALNQFTRTYIESVFNNPDYLSEGRESYQVTLSMLRIGGRAPSSSSGLLADSTRVSASQTPKAKPIAQCLQPMKDYPVAEPIPNGSVNGSWYVYAPRTKEVLVALHGLSAPPPKRITQMYMRSEAVKACASAGIQCISLGGCLEGRRAGIAMPADRSWGFVTCDQNQERAIRGAVTLCEKRAGCRCENEKNPRGTHAMQPY